MRTALEYVKDIPTVRRTARSLRYALGSHREEEVAILPFLVRPGLTAVDVGAHLGAYTHILLQLGMSVVAIEANPTLANHVNRFYGKDPNAKVVWAAASSSSGTVQLRIPADAPSGISTIEDSNPLDDQPVTLVEVEKVSLDDMDLGPVGFIKIDVEGHELEVLRGAEKLLRRDHPAILVEAEERHRPGAVQSICDFLLPLGYTGMTLDGGRLTPVTRFDIERDQAIPAGRLDDLNAGTYDGRYINNFIFVA